MPVSGGGVDERRTLDDVARNGGGVSLQQQTLHTKFLIERSQEKYDGKREIATWRKTAQNHAQSLRMLGDGTEVVLFEDLTVQVVWFEI